MDTMLTAHSSGSVQQLTPTTSLSFMALASVELIAHRVVWRKALIEPISTQSRLSPIRHELLLVRYRTHLVPISCATPPRPISNSSSSDIEHISCPSRVQLLLVRYRTPPRPISNTSRAHLVCNFSSSSNLEPRSTRCSRLSCRVPFTQMHRSVHTEASVCSHRGVGGGRLQ